MILLIISFFLTISCFNEYVPNDGILTIKLGVGSDKLDVRSITWPHEDDPENFNKMEFFIELSQNGITLPRIYAPKGEKTLRASIQAGVYDLYMEVLHDSEPYAKGFAEEKVIIIAGEKTSVTVPMEMLFEIFTINIEVEIIGDTSDSSIIRAPEIGKTGDKITLHYYIDETAFYNILELGIKNEIIYTTDKSGEGTFIYTVNPEDAIDGMIIISALFVHSDLILDPIVFKDNRGEIPVTYGDYNNTFTNEIDTDAHNGTGVITYSSSDTDIATVNASTGAVTINKVGTVNIRADKEADDVYSGAYREYTLKINSRTVTAVGITAVNRFYDGTTIITLNGGTLQNIRTGDDIRINETGTVETASVANNKAVTVTIIGADIDNYIFQPPSLTVNITPLQLTIGTPNVTTVKTYDATTNAAVTAGTLQNLVSGDTVNVSASALYNSANVLNANQITVVYTISGAGIGNYLKPLDFTASGSITPATLSLSVSAPASALSPVEPSVPVIITTNLIGTDTATVNMSGGNRITFNNTNNILTFIDHEMEYVNTSPQTLTFTANAGSNYTSNATASLTMSIFDGLVTTRTIPVTQRNIREFNAYAATAKGLTLHYRLAENVVFETDNPYTWISIGADSGSSDVTRFTGTFDGERKSITGLTIIIDSANHNSRFGMFGGIGVSGIVRNLDLVDVNIRVQLTGTSHVGSLAGINRGTIENCFVSGKVSGGTGGGIIEMITFGGLVGDNVEGTIRRCHTDVNVSTTSVVTTSILGGVAGRNSGFISNCYSTGSVIGMRDVGGIVGRNEGGSVSGFGSVSGSVSNCYSTAVVRGQVSAGGIVGRKDLVYNVSNSVLNCIVFAEVISRSDGEDTNFGRIIGNGTIDVTNYAWNGMLVIGSTVSTDSNDRNGRALTSAALKTQNPWNTAAFQFGGNETSPWVWVNGRMPRLFFETEALPWPDYLEQTRPTENGSANNPFLIMNESDLRMVGSGQPHFGGIWSRTAHYRLMTDITMTQGNVFPIANEADPNPPFNGTFDGNGFTITGLTNTSSSFNGLFGTVGSTGVIRNLGLLDVNISGNLNTGGIAGRNQGLIENCFVTGNITGINRLGGIVGVNQGRVYNCFTIVTINGQNMVGGIVGENELNGTVENSAALGMALIGSAGSTDINIGRVSGTTTGTFRNNYAWGDMPLANRRRADINATATGKDGTPVQAAQWGNVTWWRNTVFAGTNRMSDPHWALMSKHFPPSVPAAPKGVIPGNPNEIWTIEDLSRISTGVTHNGGLWTQWANYRLMADIDFGPLPAGQNFNFEPIAAFFGGIFDGRGFTITRMVPRASGMFISLNGSGIVQNFGLLNFNFDASASAGSITDNNIGLIENCFVIGTLRSTATGASFGGIARSNQGTIRNCYSIVTITGRINVGGIAGSQNVNGRIENCVALGTAMLWSGAGTEGENFGRILGNDTGTRENNYANSAMTVLGYPVTGGTTTNINGANVSTTTPNGGFNSQNFWTNTMGWNLGVTGPWYWDTTVNLPRLRK